MNILSAPTYDEVVQRISALYPDTITTTPAPGDTDRWFVLQDGYVMPRLHIVKKEDRYVFCTIPQVSTN